MLRSRRRLLVAMSLLVAGAASPAARGAGVPADNRPVAARPTAGGSESIIVLRPGVSPATVAERHGLRVGEEYQAVFNGFGATGNTAAPDIVDDPDVAAVVPNQLFRLDAGFLTSRKPDGSGTAPSPPVQTQVVPPSRIRIGLMASPTAQIDGTGPGIDADIAVIDTGIDSDHPDLNVAGGYNCTSPDRAAWQDEIGHGTAVAGVAAMEDNEIGLVGVAPGARLWSVRIFDRDAFATLEGILCAVEWVSEHADVIDVANMSFSSLGRQDGDCGHLDRDLFHTAVCRVVDRGVTMVAAAGNEAIDAGEIRPAAYPEVITVSALSDTDGVPGGLGAVSPCAPIETDDAVASFSNHGPSVDVAAPGVCVDSSLPAFLCEDGTWCYGPMSGTSLSAPFVSGAVALLDARHPDWLPAELRAFLLAGVEPRPVVRDPAPPHAEGVLSVVGY
jgi:subtilisin family serine protease